MILLCICNFVQVGHTWGNSIDTRMLRYWCGLRPNPNESASFGSLTRVFSVSSVLHPLRMHGVLLMFGKPRHMWVGFIGNGWDLFVKQFATACHALALYFKLAVTLPIHTQVQARLVDERIGNQQAFENPTESIQSAYRLDETSAKTTWIKRSHLTRQKTGRVVVSMSPALSSSSILSD